MVMLTGIFFSPIVGAIEGAIHAERRQRSPKLIYELCIIPATSIKMYILIKLFIEYVFVVN